MPKLSIITVNLNNAAGLQKTMESVFSQTFTDYEYIIIDGGSTDGSKAMIEKYQNKLAYWVSEKDDGIYQAMNKGILIANGEYLLFLNSGDYFYKNQVLLKLFSLVPVQDLVYGNQSLTGYFLKKYPAILSLDFFLRDTLPHQATFIRRELFDKTGLFSTKYAIANDYKFFLEALFKHQCTYKYLDVTIVNFDMSGLSNQQSHKVLDEFTSIRNEIFGDGDLIKLSGGEKISIIMPAYNAAKFIQESIDSVLHQTFLNWELIIIDDGSTDNTADIIQKYVNADERILYYYQQNGKQGKARNLGIKYAKGNYLAFLDADDVWMPEKLAIQIKEIKERNVDLVFSDSYFFTESSNIDTSKIIDTLHGEIKGNEALELFFVKNRIPNLTVLVKKEKVLQVAGFDEKIEIQNAEDYHLWLKLLIKNCSFYGSEQVLAAYRIHDKSSTSNDKLAAKQVVEVFKDIALQNPQIKLLMQKTTKDKFRNKYKRSLYTKVSLNTAIEDNCNFLSKTPCIPIFKVINYFFGTRITKKFLNLFLNA